MRTKTRIAVALTLAAPFQAGSVAGQDHQHLGSGGAPAVGAGHRMASVGLGGWRLAGMAQGYLIGSAGEEWGEGSPLGERAVYLTQPALMGTLVSPDGILSLRATLNLEGWTQPAGELSYGAWGEGFLDRRHPHTLIHEAIVTVRFPEVPGGSFSMSAGKGFPPYGTEDPMGRPVAKFPVNHHLSQVVERFTMMAAYRHRGGTSVELGVFGGSEPEGVYDLSNVSDFGNSFSARITQRLGDRAAATPPWEVSVSYARVTERHHDQAAVTHLANLAVRHERSYGFGRVTALAEASNAAAPQGERYWSMLAEAKFELGRGGRHQPYLRSELSTRPEFQRDGAPGSPGFFRYDHDHAGLVGATRWFTQTVGYGVAVSGYPVAAMPFIEVQRFEVRRERGGVTPEALFSRGGFWSATAGVRIFLGGGQMPMGRYGVAGAAGAPSRSVSAATQLAERAGSHAHH